MPDLIAAIDQGTTSTRCMLFDAGGRVAGMAQAEHEQIYPRPGWVEHDPAEIWTRTQQVVRDAIEGASAAGRIAAVGITNQRETIVFWDRATGEPVTNAIVWQDTRTKDLCEQLAGAAGPDRFRAATGLPLATYFSGPKIRWALEQVDGLRAAASSGDVVCGTIESWLIRNLTGEHVTDVTNAARTLLMDLRTLDWDDGILEAMGVPRAMLPRIVPSSDAAGWGRTKPNGPFGDTIPVCGAVGDQQAALIGQCCFEKGEAKNTYGTGCFLLLNTGHEPVASTCGLLTTVAYQRAGEPPAYALEGSVAIAGALVQWLRDNLGIIDQAPDIEPLARTVDDAGGIYFVPAFSGLFAPRWRADARGVIVGLTRYITKAHLARAALEAVCFQTREVLEAMHEDAGIELKSLKVDGGMVANELLMQMQADILGRPVVRPIVTETTALGAAYAAGIAVGLFESIEDLRRQWQVDRTWEPALDAAARDEMYEGWLRAVDRSLGWIE
ncbi:MAG: glycerol kinase GlpK [Planctomycetota bacterium]|jgi:glycerol kinase